MLWHVLAAVLAGVLVLGGTAGTFILLAKAGTPSTSMPVGKQDVTVEGAD